MEINTSETKRALEAVLEYRRSNEGTTMLSTLSTLDHAIRAMSAVPSYYHEDILRGVFGLNKPQEGEASGDAE